MAASSETLKPMNLDVSCILVHFIDPRDDKDDEKELREKIERERERERTE